MPDDSQSAASKWADIVKPFAPYLAALLIGGGVGAYSHNDAQVTSTDVSRKMVWSEGGPHWEDLVQTNALWSAEIELLKAQVAELKKK